jgi:protein-S-isoprenylcysteine O-methyltransferase Ste14
MTNRRKGHHSSDRRQSLAGEHAFTDIGQLILLALFLVVWITDSFIFHYTDFPAQHIPLYIRLPIAAVVLIAAAVLALRAHEAVFGGTAEEYRLLTDGVFSIVRHPMYLGTWLFFAGLAISTLSLASAAVCVVIALFYHRVSKTEERLLEAKFGAEYQEYKKRVPMFLPLKFTKE